MKDIIFLIIISLVRIGCIAIGAWLVVESHPWFGLFVMLLAMTMSFSNSGGDNEKSTKNDDLVQAASNLASTAMLTHLQDWSDDTGVQIKVDAPDGFTRHLSLGEYRRFMTELLKFTAD